MTRSASIGVENGAQAIDCVFNGREVGSRGGEGSGISASPEDIDHFGAWCHSLACNVLSHHFRSKRRRAELMARIERESGLVHTGHGVDPERAASARQLLNRLGTQLDPQARALLSRRYLLGESTEAIALRLAQSATAVRMRLMRLRSIAKRKAS
jgi:RNA polymerase sigma factor (sigma-70 family)